MGQQPPERLHHLRREPATRDIPVVVLSADATRHHIEQLEAAGVAAYLTKPIAVRELLGTLDDLLDTEPIHRTGASGPAARTTTPPPTKRSP